MPHAQCHRTGGLTGFTRIGMRGESTQIDPIESGSRLLQNIRFPSVPGIIGTIRRTLTITGQLPVHGSGIAGVAILIGFAIDTRDVNRNHMLAAGQPHVATKEHAHGSGVPFQSVQHICAGQRGQAHRRILIVGFDALPTRHRYSAVTGQHHRGGGFEQHLAQQIRFAASFRFIIDVALCQRQEGKHLRECQRIQCHISPPVSSDRPTPQPPCPGVRRR